MRYFFRVEYDGGAYHGWQRQPTGLCVQEVLESAFATAARQPVTVTGAGRTDAGVHARRQGAHIDLVGTIDLPALLRSVNAILPPDVAIGPLQAVPDSFHARFSATARRYRYYIRRSKCALDRNRTWAMGFAVDWDRASRELTSIVGTHDFSAFNASGSSVDVPVCTLNVAALEHADGQWVFCLEANRFVYRMVRSIVGTVVDICRGELDDSLISILASRDRSRVGSSAPAWGLVLDDVVYPGVDG